MMNPIERRLAKEQVLTVEEARRFLAYDPETGRLTWRIDKGRAKAGDEAGKVTPAGYRYFELHDRKHMAHRVAWLLVHGVWPVFDLDHISGDKADNRLANLREATRSQNCMNRRRHNTNTSGVKGVYPHKKNGTWCAVISKRYLGSFKSISEASEAYRRAATVLHGQFARPS
jgi:hypothetical protein